MEPQQQATCESAIQLGDLTINAKGGKYVPLRRNGGPPVWQSAEWQKIIWHPAAFNDPRGSVPGARRGLHGAAPGDRAAPRQGPDGAVAF